jgi:DNA-binding MarR family transcriptional regulator
MKLFASLRKLREFERLELPFLKSLIDFDIIIEIGYAEEQKQSLTPKQLFLLNLGSPTTVRRRLAKLVEQGIVTRRTNAKDRRSDVLAIGSSSLKVLGKYGKVLTATSVMP